VAVYTDITDVELERFLERYALGAPRTFKGIAEGVENSNFYLETEKGRFILTVYERRVSGADLPFFIGLMSHLADRGFPCPTPIPDCAGEPLQTLRGKPAALVSFLQGVSVRDPGPAHCEEAGSGLARLHLASAGFRGRRPNSLGHASWSPLFEPLRESAAARGVLADILQDLAELGRDWPRGLTVGVIHADLFPDNVFFVDGRFSAAIDFYFACEDALAYDLAVCLNAWCFTPEGDLKRDAVQRLIKGYERLRPLSPEERSSLPILARGAAMRFYITRLADWGRADPGALVRPKDPGEYERKLAFHRSPAGRRALETSLESPF
jgi:homoserine kinase type II